MFRFNNPSEHRAAPVGEVASRWPARFKWIGGLTIGVGAAALAVNEAASIESSVLGAMGAGAILLGVYVTAMATFSKGFAGIHRTP